MNKLKAEVYYVKSWEGNFPVLSGSFFLRSEEEFYTATGTGKDPKFQNSLARRRFFPLIFFTV